MMMEYEFRAWDKINQVMIFDIGNTIGGYDYYFNNSDEFIVEQYTGKKDRDGNKIYLGDKVKGFEMNGTFTEYTVEFIDGGFCFRQIGCEGFFENIGRYKSSQIVTIGHIHLTT